MEVHAQLEEALFDVKHKRGTKSQKMRRKEKKAKAVAEAAETLQNNKYFPEYKENVVSEAEPMVVEDDGEFLTWTSQSHGKSTTKAAAKAKTGEVAQTKTTKSKAVAKGYYATDRESSLARHHAYEVGSAKGSDRETSLVRYHAYEAGSAKGKTQGLLPPPIPVPSSARASDRHWSHAPVPRAKAPAKNTTPIGASSSGQRGRSVNTRVNSGPSDGYISCDAPCSVIGCGGCCDRRRNHCGKCFCQRHDNRDPARKRGWEPSADDEVPPWRRR